MDGRVGAMRRALKEGRTCETRRSGRIGKYASALLRPLCDAVGSVSNWGKSNIKLPTRWIQAIRMKPLARFACDLSEGAGNMVMIQTRACPT